MKINSNRENLLKGIQRIQSGVSSRLGTIPILQNFLMETEDSGLKVVFTDLEMAVKHYINVDIKSDGSITVPIKKFAEILHVLNEEEEISVSVDDSNKVYINSGKTKFKLIGSPKSEYPVIPDMDETNLFRIPAEILLDIILKTIFSAATEDDRHFLNGLLWIYEKNKLSIVATDGRRLALISNNEIKAKKDFKVIIPSKVLNEVGRFIEAMNSPKSEDVLIGISTNQIGFKTGKTMFISRLIEGNFPAYEQIVPKNRETSIEINTEKLLATTKRAAICSNERGGAVKYTFKKGVLIVSSSSQNMDFEDELDIDFKGKDFQVSFNPRFLIDILRNIGIPKVALDFTVPSSPVVIRPPEKENLLYIVMPLRTQ
ncbi:MAG: DNA polymerase III subunit beta [Elusimicrobia bacterium]|nr:DNA polymerase III subunit beta [Elusimicrobiota bacterium]